MIRDLTDPETLKQYEGFKDDTIESLRAKVATFAVYLAEVINNPDYDTDVQSKWLSRAEAIGSAYSIRRREI